MSGRLLIAEDEEAVRAFLVRGLVHAGYTVTAVADGQEALEVLDRGEPFDLLLTDIVMPRLDGIALALKATQAYPAMKILMMTGYAAEQQRAYGMEALSHEVISKPFSLQKIISLVGSLIDG